MKHGNRKITGWGVMFERQELIDFVKKASGIMRPEDVFTSEFAFRVQLEADFQSALSSDLKNKVNLHCEFEYANEDGDSKKFFATPKDSSVKGDYREFNKKIPLYPLSADLQCLQKELEGFGKLSTWTWVYLTDVSE